METKQAKERGRYWLKRLEIEEYENRKLENFFLIALLLIS